MGLNGTFAPDDHGKEESFPAAMHLVHKLVLISLTAVVLIWLVGLAGARVAEKSLLISIERFSEERASAALDEVAQELRARMDEWRAHTFNQGVLGLLGESNEKFLGMRDLAGVLTRREKDWRGTPAQVLNPLMRSVLSNGVAKQFFDILEMYNEAGGAGDYRGVLLTNLFGANVAQTNRTADYRQSDDLWWIETMEKGRFIGGLRFDDEQELRSLDLCLRVDDGAGKPMGVLKVVLNARAIARILDRRFVNYGGSEGSDVTLFSSKRRILHHVGAARQVGDVADELAAFRDMESAPGKSAVVETNPRGSGESGYLYTLAEFPVEEDGMNLGWSLLIRHPAKVALADIDQLWVLVLWVAGLSTALTIAMGAIIGSSVSRRSGHLTEAIQKLGEGELGVRVRVRGKDEFSSLGNGFNRMAEEIEKLTNSAQVKVLMLATQNKELAREVQDRQRAEGLASQVLESTADPIVVIDAAGVMVSASDSVETVFQWQPKEAIGQAFTSLVSDDDHDAHNRSMLALMSPAENAQGDAGARQPARAGEPLRLHGQRKDGTHFPMEVTTSRVLSSAEPMFVKILRDLSVRLRLEEELECARRLESIGQLAAGIAHEINTPTQYVGGQRPLSGG